MLLTANYTNNETQTTLLQLIFYLEIDKNIHIIQKKLQKACTCNVLKKQ